MTLFNRNRPAYKTPHPLSTVGVHPCTVCGDTTVSIPTSKLTIHHGTLGMDATFTCPRCGETRRNELNLEVYGKLSAVFAVIVLHDEEMEDVRRRNVGAWKVDPKVFPLLVDAALSGYGLTVEPERVRVWCGSHRGGVLKGDS